MNRGLLTIPQILAWADEYHERTGKWPNRDAGRISRSLGETWCGIEQALRKCGRGLHVPGISLARLLDEQRGVRNRMQLPRFTERQILAWAIAHHDRSRTWPTHNIRADCRSPGRNLACCRNCCGTIDVGDTTFTSPSHLPERSPRAVVNNSPFARRQRTGSGRIAASVRAAGCTSAVRQGPWRRRLPAHRR